MPNRNLRAFLAFFCLWLQTFTCLCLTQQTVLCVRDNHVAYETLVQNATCHGHGEISSLVNDSIASILQERCCTDISATFPTDISRIQRSSPKVAKPLFVTVRLNDRLSKPDSGTVGLTSWPLRLHFDDNALRLRRSVVILV